MVARSVCDNTKKRESSLYNGGVKGKFEKYSCGPNE